jgi:hypothetical protein
METNNSGLWQISKIGLFSSAIFNAIEQASTRENKHEIDVWSKICQTPVIILASIKL